MPLAVIVMLALAALFVGSALRILAQALGLLRDVARLAGSIFVHLLGSFVAGAALLVILVATLLTQRG